MECRGEGEIFLPFIAREEEKRGADGDRGHEKEKGEQGLAMEEEVFELAPNEADVPSSMRRIVTSSMLREWYS